MLRFQAIAVPAARGRGRHRRRVASLRLAPVAAAAPLRLAAAGRPTTGSASLGARLWLSLRSSLHLWRALGLSLRSSLCLRRLGLRLWLWLWPRGFRIRAALLARVEALRARGLALRLGLRLPLLLWPRGLRILPALLA